MCCVRAGHAAEGVAARPHMMGPDERVLIIPVVVDRSNNSDIYIYILLRLVLLERSSF